MKLATYKDGSRDGQLIVVSRDLASAHFATGITTRMQQLLDDWNFLSPQLEDLYASLNDGKARHAFAFDPRLCMAPLPRAYQWAAGLAYLHHVALQRAARNEPPPEGADGEPLMHQGGGDCLLGAHDQACFVDPHDGIDFQPGIAVVTGDVPMGCGPDQALDTIRLVMLANDWTLRHLACAEQARGSGLIQSKPGTAFSPVAATPDELGDAWRAGRVHLTLTSRWNGKAVGMNEAGPEMDFHFGQLIAHLAHSRRLQPGCIVGNGPVSNRDRSHGHGCIADKRALETAEDGAPKTAFMQFGDTVRIEMKGADGLSLFGAIEQTVSSVI